MTSLLGTRPVAGSPTALAESTQQAATIKVADRVHDASKSLAERFQVTDAFYNTTSEVRGLQHVLATVDEDTYVEQDTDATPGMTDDHPIMWCQDLEGGRSFYTGLGHNPATFANANVRQQPRGRDQVGEPAGRTRSTATAAPRCSPTTSRSRSRRRRT